MTTPEWIDFLELLHQLPEEELRKIYYMTKGVLMVAEKEKAI